MARHLLERRSLGAVMHCGLTSSLDLCRRRIWRDFVLANGIVDAPECSFIERLKLGLQGGRFDGRGVGGEWCDGRRLDEQNVDWPVVGDTSNHQKTMGTAGC
jgi:hypothetical protein